MRYALAILMALHGVAHLIGFLVPWRLLESEEVEYKTTILSGRLDLGEPGIKVFGFMWLVVAIAFGVAAFLGWTNRIGWEGFALAVTAASMVMCLLSLPEARIGVVVNIAIGAAIVFGGFR